MSLPSPLSPELLESRWGDLKRALEIGGIRAFEAAVKADGDVHAEQQLLRFAIRMLGGSLGATTSDLDAMIEIGKMALQHALDAAKRRPLEEAAWKDEANICAYNLAANLCDCCGDGESRASRHFEAGLAFAEHALMLRRELVKGPGPFAMAYWVRGKHLLSLAQPSEAAEAFRAALACEEELFRREAGKLGAEDEASPSLMLTKAFLGLALARAGDPTGTSILEEALACLRSRAENGQEHAREEAKAYLAQIGDSIRRN